MKSVATPKEGVGAAWGVDKAKGGLALGVDVFPQWDLKFSHVDGCPWQSLLSIPEVLMACRG